MSYVRRIHGEYIYNLANHIHHTSTSRERVKHQHSDHGVATTPGLWAVKNVLGSQLFTLFTLLHYTSFLYIVCIFILRFNFQLSTSIRTVEIRFGTENADWVLMLMSGGCLFQRSYDVFKQGLSAHDDQSQQLGRAFGSGRGTMSAFRAGGHHFVDLILISG